MDLLIKIELFYTSVGPKGSFGGAASGKTIKNLKNRSAVIFYRPVCVNFAAKVVRDLIFNAILCKVLFDYFVLKIGSRFGPTDKPDTKRALADTKKALC